MKISIKTSDSVHISREELLRQHEEKRTKCLIYTRVMGYHRPVESFNIGKKGEHRQRVFFREP
ncbi:anaerobic ribonucleoside-triphosphate reductase [Balneolaceae bacterium ANBcel3]|nr:anaerobic ribonucleoside-triphosphate reductase [Balneolaceae bacterium ANBcel3]